MKIIYFYFEKINSCGEERKQFREKNQITREKTSKNNNNSLEVEGLLLGYSSIAELFPNMNKDLDKIPRATIMGGGGNFNCKKKNTEWASLTKIPEI